MKPRTALQADALRGIPLERVAAALGYRRDPRDRARWKRPGSILSIDGAKFYDHLSCTGGGGAIDLVLYARRCRFPEALETLASIAPHPAAPDGRPFQQLLEPAFWPAVQEYLSRNRSLDPAILNACFRQSILGADRRSNAVFIACGAERSNRTGAELLGTQPGTPFRGMAPGSRKSRGGFWIARRKPPQTALIVESAVDALSAFELPEMKGFDLFLSTAGLANDPPAWSNAFQLQNIACGYDADPPGDQAAERLIRKHSRVRRCRPQGAKDWNEVLQNRKSADAQHRTKSRQEHGSPSRYTEQAD